MKSLLFLFFFFVERSFSQSLLEKEIIHKINYLRKVECLDTLLYSDSLSIAAKHHAQYLALSGDFSHEETVPLKGHKRLFDLEQRCEEYGFRRYYQNCTCENILLGFNRGSIQERAESAVMGWFESSGHRKCLLAGNSKRVQGLVGISVVQSTKFKDDLYYVMVIAGKLKK